VITLCFTRRFSMAHRLISDPHSRCAVPHGHNEFVRVQLSADQSLSQDNRSWGLANRTHDFSELKSRWHAFIDKSLDHGLQLSVHDPLLDYFQNIEPQRLKNIVTINGDPTTEALSIALCQKLSAILQNQSLPYRIEQLSLEETPTNTIILTPNHETYEINLGSWCRRADFSINDLIPAENWESF
jgi:6-pyruvoyltetrahydropterin/6-carboxytetrahydropterin synthase